MKRSVQQQRRSPHFSAHGMEKEAGAESRPQRQRQRFRSLCSVLLAELPLAEVEGARGSASGGARAAAAAAAVLARKAEVYGTAAKGGINAKAGDVVDVESERNGEGEEGALSAAAATMHITFFLLALNMSRGALMSLVLPALLCYAEPRGGAASSMTIRRFAAQSLLRLAQSFGPQFKMHVAQGLGPPEREALQSALKLAIASK